MTAESMLIEARTHLGLGEPNFIQAWYRKRNGNGFAGDFAWCDAFITYCAYKSGNYKAVCPLGDRALTTTHAEDFDHLGRWYTGTAGNVDRAQPGDIVFFDWGDTNVIEAIDHVGVVETVLGSGRVQTIEGNCEDVCRRKVRSHTAIAGYGRPAYAAAPPPNPIPTQTEDIVRQLPTLKRGARGEDVKTLQHLLLARGQHLDNGADGDFGGETETALVAATGSSTCGIPQWANLLLV